MTVLRAVVTAGGTSEPIDDVRVVTNLSSGRLGAAIASALADAGVRTVLITSGASPSGAGRALSVVKTRSTDDLRRAIDTAIQEPVDLFFMAAAVSDYAPQAATGKLSSDADELVVRMGRAPKILPTLRTGCGPDAFLVGFKLLSGAARDTMVSVARRQIEHNRTDACFSNDLTQLGPDHHPGILVLPDGTIPLDGDKIEVAHRLVAHVLARVDPARDRRLAPALPTPLIEWADPAELARARAALREALGHTGIDPAAADDPAAVPLLADASVVGLVVRGPSGEAVPFVLPEHRSQGLGDAICERLTHLGQHVLAPVAHSGWWIARGWRVLAEIGGAVRLEPPGLRPPDVIGASVALIHAPTDRVLLGRRLSPPAKGDWAFPGGRTEPGEAPIDTALRELQEETGIALKPRTDPHLRTTVFAADDQGTTVFRIVNLLWLIDEAPEPKPTETLDSRWLSLSDVDAMRPVVAGVRRVLRRWRSPREAIAARPD